MGEVPQYWSMERLVPRTQEPLPRESPPSLRQDHRKPPHHTVLVGYADFRSKKCVGPDTRATHTTRLCQMHPPPL